MCLLSTLSGHDRPIADVRAVWETSLLMVAVEDPMHKLPVFLASVAAIGGAASMILIATAPRSSVTLPVFVVVLVITLGAASSAKRLSRQTRV